MKTTLNILLCVILCALLVSAAAPASAAPSQDDFSTVDAYIEETMLRFPIPFSIIGVGLCSLGLFRAGMAIASRRRA